MDKTNAFIESMSEQALFDYVIDKLRKQGRRSEGQFDCVYRGDNGAKCAAGWLIADEEYIPSMECRSWSSVSKVYGATTRHKDLISDLQSFHDDQLTWRCFEEAAAQFAEEHGLEYTAPEEHANA